MLSGIPLFPEQASTMASQVDNLYFFLIAVTAFFAILVTGRYGQLAQSLAEQAALDDGLEVSLVGRPDLDLAVAGSSRSAIVAARPDLSKDTHEVVSRALAD